MKRTIEIYYCDLCEKTKTEKTEMKSISLNNQKIDLCSTCYDSITIFFWRKDSARESNIV